MAALPFLLVEIAVYSVLVTGYLLVVLRALSPFLLRISQDNRVLYAALAVALMLGQGVVLEFATTLLVKGLARLAGKGSAAAKALGE
jgi:hypothetical protein